MIRKMVPFVVWNGLYCKVLGGWDLNNPMAKLQTLTGTVFRAHYWEIEITQFHNEPNKGNV